MKRVPDETEELHIYECRGTGYPATTPSCEGFVGIWPEPPYYYLFFQRPVPPEVVRWIRDQEGWALTGTYRLDYDQWQQISTECHRVGPFLIGTSIGEPDEKASPGGIPVQLHPSVVFGSGLHATTRGCLLAIAALCARDSVEGAVDLGTGTGILAIACALLGVPKVIALDCNPLAVQVAQRNVAGNKVDKTVHMVVAQELEVLSRPSDLLIMNLEWPCLKKVLRGNQWFQYRWVILSGFLETQWNELKSLLPRDVSVDQCRSLEGWMTVVVGAGDPNRIPCASSGWV